MYANNIGKHKVIKDTNVICVRSIRWMNLNQIKENNPDKFESDAICGRIAKRTIIKFYPI